jgi:hypothetical protein
MLGLLSLLALGALGYFSAAIVREYGRPAVSVSLTTWRAATVIAVARLVVLYVGFPLLAVNLVRPLGLLIFLLVMGSSGLEMGMAAAFSGSRTPLGPSVLLAALVTLTSIPLGFAWSWIRTRPRSGRTA